MIRKFLSRRTERRRLADWAWQKETMILSVLTGDQRFAQSATTIAESLAFSVVDVKDLISQMMRPGYIDIVRTTARGYGAEHKHSTLYFLTPAGITEYTRRGGR